MKNKGRRNTLRTKKIKTSALVASVVVMIIASEMALAQEVQAGGLAGFLGELLSTIVYSVVGIVMGVVGFKVVDWLTPGNLAEEVASKENRALAVLAGSMMLGVCIIIAAVLVS